MKRVLVIAFGTAVLAVVAAVWFVRQGPAPEVVPPRAMMEESPFEYPLALWDAGVEGESLVMVRVDAAGAVDSVYVLESGGEPAFDSAAVAGARTMTFLPARQGDAVVSAWVRLPVRFELPASPTFTRSESEAP
ncbi:MAG TPA: energy transducer TonB [Longimicrobiales bacterium]|nr:energy transducer TonB [Longimicrobiales bacterium]